MEWWVIPETTGQPGLGNFAVVSGTSAAVHAKYGFAYGPYSSQSAAQAAAAKPNGPGGGIAGTSTGVVKQGVQAASQALTNGVLPENWFMRAGEIFIGLILLAIGLNTLLKGTPVGDAAKTVAGAVPKVIPV